MIVLDTLPDDVLIPIIQYCFLEDVLSLRSTCKSLRAVIDFHIKIIAPAVARQTFPASRLLLRPPLKGYSLRWLKALIPAQLAAIVFDKDKLRRFPYLNAGFPYGIPSENETGDHWRGRVANGWRLLERLSIISKEAYARRPAELGHRIRSDPFVSLSKLSTAIRSTRLVQLATCQYQRCTEHAVQNVFSYWKGRDPDIEEIRKREEYILARRLELISTLADSELEDYLLVWRLLLWTFRPYRRPHEITTTAALAALEGVRTIVKPNWQIEISNIRLGCSWLNWFVPHVGPAIFWRQWWSEDSRCNAADAAVSSTLKGIATSDYVRDLIWNSWAERSCHQIEIERDYASKFERALRRRCLSPDRQKILQIDDKHRSTISLDCIPCSYNQSPIINRPPSDFPWYESDSWLWLNRDIWLQLGQLRLAKSTQVPHSEIIDPLARVPYLVYLGVEDALSVWDSCDASASFELVF